MAGFEHFAKYPICVFAAFVSSFGVFTIYPSEHDHLAGSVVAKKQSVLLKKLCKEPALVFVAESVSLSIFCPCRVLRDDIESELGDRRQSLAGGFLRISNGVFLPEGIYLLSKSFNLCMSNGWAKTVHP